jgi:hypothetical protein
VLVFQQYRGKSAIRALHPRRRNCAHCFYRWTRLTLDLLAAREQDFLISGIMKGEAANPDGTLEKCPINLEMK